MLSIPFGTAIAQDIKEPLNIDDVISPLAIDEQTCIILYDTASGEVLYEQNANANTKTASTAKLLTCVAAL